MLVIANITLRIIAPTTTPKNKMTAGDPRQGAYDRIDGVWR